MAQKTGLITGATDGVGKLVARGLARAGFRVIVHGRSEAKGRAVVHEIQRETGNPAIEYRHADFGALAEVHRLAEEVGAAHPRLDLLINNAGIGYGQPETRRETSRDGYELRLAVNYLAPFLLTHQLLPTLRASTPARIVNVASIGQAPIDFDDPMLARQYDGSRAYHRSKLALVMFTFDLAAALRGTGVTANAVHPATFMNTKMVAESGIQPHSTVEDGARAILRLATAPELEEVSGKFFDAKREAAAHPDAYDPTRRERLRRVSLELTDLAPPRSRSSAA